MVKVKTDKTNRANSSVLIRNVELNFDDNCIAEVNNEDKAKELVETVDDISFVDHIPESKTETLDGEEGNDELPTDTARDELNKMSIKELRDMVYQYDIMTYEKAKEYKNQEGKKELVELLVNQVSNE
jgi:hypothetical protein